MNWEIAAKELHAIQVAAECNNQESAFRALTEFLDEPAILDGIKQYLSFHPDGDLVRSMFMLLRPLIAMQRCYTIYKQDSSPERRQRAVELLKWTGDRRVLEWFPEFLNDSESGIQNMGIEILDQLTFCGFVEQEEAEPFLQLGEQHVNSHVRRMTGLVRHHFGQATKEPIEVLWSEWDYLHHLDRMSQE